MLKDANFAIGDFANPGIESSKRHLFILLKDQRIQGLLCLSERVKDLYINVLISAAWNIPMCGAVAEAHEDLRVKGVGTTLMHVAYKTAQKLNVNKLALLCLPSSYGFYKDYMNMCVVVDEDQGEGNFWDGWHIQIKFELDVSSEVPKQLLKNILIDKVG